MITRGLVHLGQPLQIKTIAEELSFCSGDQALTTGVAENNHWTIMSLQYIIIQQYFVDS